MFSSVPEPSVTVVHAGEAQVENKELILVCQVNISEQVNSPITMNISWYHGNEQITPANADMYTTSLVNMMSNSMYEGRLTIKQLQVGRDNGTMYRCVSTLSSSTDVLLRSNGSAATTININGEKVKQELTECVQLQFKCNCTQFLFHLKIKCKMYIQKI